MFGRATSLADLSSVALTADSSIVAGVIEESAVLETSATDTAAFHFAFAV